MYCAQIIKDRIKNLCKLQNISMKQMLSDCSLGANSIQQINDLKGMASFSLAKIADYLDCSVDYLLGRVETPAIINLPDELADCIMDLYNNKTDKFIIEKEFIFYPKIYNYGVYSFDAKNFDSKYMKIYEKARDYAKKNDLEIIDKDKYMNKLIKYHGDVVSRAVGTFYTFKGQKEFNEFHEVYKLYVKAYAQELLNGADVI